MKNIKIKDYFKEAKILNNHYIAGITDKSNEVKNNYVFVAIKGSRNNGFDYINDAIKNGAKTIVSEDERILNLNINKINFIYCIDAKLELANLLNKKYSHQCEKIKIIGVTGTNAKTSICSLVYKYLRYLGINTMYIGTNGVYLDDIIYKTKNTTLDIVNFYKCLNYAVDNNYKYIVMEVSSQGLKECRVKYLDFDIGLISNITIDHLDYHKTFDDYFYTKVNFLNCCKKVIINYSCEKYLDIIRILNHSEIYTYGIGESKYFVQPDYYATELSLSLVESNFILHTKKDHYKYYLNTTLLGEFNVSNIVAMIAIIDNLEEGKYFKNKIFSFLKQKIDISGRFEIIKSIKGNYIIDFAHTPDGIFKVLSFLRSVCAGKLIVVLGMGGNRDVSKRPIVGEIVSKFADYFIVTSDNPRDEDNDLIICDILKGINCEYNNNVIIINDRYEAIEKGYLIANEEDIVAILGKGNEEDQVIKGVSYSFNDKKVLKKIISKYQGEYYE